MNLFYMSLIMAGVFGLFEAGKMLVKHFLKKELNKYYQAGFNQAANHVYNQVEKTGKIDLVLDGKRMTVVALKEKK